MTPQDLSTRITIEEPFETRSATGGVVTEWRTFAERWAKPSYAGGKEFPYRGQIAHQLLGEVDAAFVIRAPLAVTNKMRVSMGSRKFNILAVDDISDRYFLTINCREGKSTQ